MQFQVPQFIETEDKLVGPLTLRQFVYVGVGAGASALLYFMLQTWLWFILTVLILGGAAALAFVKVNGRPFAKVLSAAFHFYWQPQAYVWKAEHHALPQQKTPERAGGGRLEAIAQGMALHKAWTAVQTGQKESDKQFVEQKMSQRYQIFRERSGDRNAARRVDYR